MEFGNKNSCINCSRQPETFQYLTEEELKLFDENRYELTYNPGEMIFKQGSAMTHILSFTVGLGKVYLEGLDGKNLVIKLIKPGDFIIGPGLHTDFKHHFSISAVTLAQACFIDVQVFLKVSEKNHLFAKHTQRLENISMFHCLQKFISLTQKHMTGRVADALLYLHDTIFKKNPFSMGISRQDLADMTGLSKESAIRILKEFKDGGIIKMYNNHMEILDMDGLKRFAEYG